MSQISLLHYELDHPPNISPDEMIGVMSLGHGDGTAHAKGRISNKTHYIALNHQERVDRLNSDAHKEVVDCLIELEREQAKLEYCIALLKDKQQETVVRRFYFEGHTWNEIAQELNVVMRTVHKIKNHALDRLAEMYTFTNDPWP